MPALFRLLFKTFIFLLLTLKADAPLLLSAEPCRYNFGIVPTFHPETILETWNPILRELGKRMNCQFDLKTFVSFSDLRKSFEAEKLDFALAGPYQVILAKKRAGYIPILRDKDPIRTILVVRKDSRFYSIYSLNGTTIGFPDPNSLITTIYMQKILREDYQITFKAKYLKTHDNIYRHVVLGLVSAGCGLDQTLRRQPPEIRDKLHVIFESEPFPSPAIVVHPRVPREFREALTNNFLEISKEEPLKRILSKTQIPNPTLADYDRDYRPLERLRLEKKTGSR